jgi:hypothetical protein
VIEPSSRCINQVNGEELDDENIVIHLTYPICEAIVLQPSAGIDFAIVLDDLIAHYDRLAVDRGGAPSLAGEPWSTS